MAGKTTILKAHTYHSKHYPILIQLFVYSDKPEIKWVDVRKMYTNPKGELRPLKGKGVCFRTDDWCTVIEFVSKWSGYAPKGIPEPTETKVQQLDADNKEMPIPPAPEDELTTRLNKLGRIK